MKTKNLQLPVSSEKIITTLLDSFSLHFPPARLVVDLFKHMSKLCFERKTAIDIALLSVYMFVIVFTTIDLLGQLDVYLYYQLLIACIAAIPAAAYYLRIEYRNRLLCRAYKMLNLHPHNQ